MKSHIPWQVKIVAKILLSRLPVTPNKERNTYC